MTTRGGGGAIIVTRWTGSGVAGPGCGADTHGSIQVGGQAWAGLPDTDRDSGQSRAPQGLQKGGKGLEEGLLWLQLQQQQQQLMPPARRRRCWISGCKKGGVYKTGYSIWV